MRTLEIPQMLAYIGSRILSQNRQNGAVWTRAQKLGFINPLGRISDPLEHLFNFQNLVLSGSPRLDAKYFQPDAIRLGGFAISSERILQLLWFSSFLAPGLGSGLGFPTLVEAPYSQFGP